MSSKQISSSGTSPYDPQYDPLVHSSPGANRNYAPTYWVDSVNFTPESDGVLQGDIDVDVVIVGAGLTGLAAAIYLASEHNITATVLEANQVSWGCTSRNGGQVLYTAGRLARSQWLQRWNKSIALKMHSEMEAAYDGFRGLLATHNIQCDVQEEGHLHIAHRKHAFDALRREAKILKDVYSYPVELLDRASLHSQFVKDEEACGAMLEPKGLGIHPLKLAFGYLRVARALGVRIYCGSPVLSLRSKDGRHYLSTPGGQVRTRAVGFATGGYTSNELHRAMSNRYFPVLSNSVVTRPLTASELDDTGFRTSRAMTDTRILRHYYRKLPDQRIQIGSRGAITGIDAGKSRHYSSLLEGFFRKFPMLRGIDIDYSWWGWVDVSHDMMPRVFRDAQHDNVSYALGYGGSGVMYSARAGKHLAHLLAGKNLPDLPIFNSPLPRSTVAPLRRIGQRALYQWYKLRDERR